MTHGPQLGLGAEEPRRPDEPIRLTDFDDNGLRLRDLRDRLKDQTSTAFDLEIFIEWLALSRLCEVGVLSMVDLNDGLDEINRRWRLGIQSEELAQLAQRVWDKLNNMSTHQRPASPPAS